MSKKFFIIFFIVLLVLGISLRFYQLGQVPNSLNWDEVSWGYSAYSIVETGRDEYGNVYPLSFRAFGDYKQPVYVYLTTLPISLFDLTPFAVRFPSAFFGSLSIILVFLFTYELFKKERYVRPVALLTMAFYAISPWSIQFSRVAYEANVGLFFVILGSWLLIRGMNNQKNWYFFAGAIALSLSAYTYHSDKLFAPILFIVLLVYGWKYFVTRRALAIALIIVFGFCNIFWVIDSRTTARGKGVLFTANQTKLLETPIQQMQYDKEHGDYLGSLFHNRRIVIVQTYITNYLEHFNPNWLFITGDNPRHHAPSMGLLYFANVFFLLLGMFYLLKKKPYVASILFAWLFLAPVASALAVEAPNASRSLIFLPTWHIFEAFGWWYAFSYLKDNRLRMIFIIPLMFFLINVGYFLHQYFVHTNTDSQKEWQYGYKEAIQYLDTDTDHRVVFSKNFEQPYIFYLFYKKYDPDKYIQSGGSTRLSEKCHAIDNAYFGECLDKLRKGDFYVGIGDETIPNTNELKRFDFASGKPATKVYRYE